ncbi:meiotic recombination protein SPO11-1 isoform X3 [Brachypodium distachyon]|uniref:meiotic recombination protein SPO11-1 isoform X3 n=1 Tax=Brachypodium distachyon TaxID=15368 RepID=UPI000D0D9B3B|nr:meiotic recombination protein SPO11-1 isoform X3 [Brachypodium distachyon]|eukprot:XP_024313733.1 meiotic recombination protein SPO11-1 isoform X3 [Brachypodium distachyon]
MEGREKRRRATVLDDDDELRGRRREQEAALLLHKIKGLVGWVVAEVGAGRSPSVALNRYQNYCTSAAASPPTCACSYDAPVGTDILCLLRKEFHASRLSVLLRVLFVVQQLLQQNKHCSKRDIYYMYPSIFIEQAVVDRAINDICILFKCSRHNLNVVPVAKGLVMGWIRFVEGEKKVYCITNVNAAFSIPVSIETIKDIVSVAHYILVVEKETVFQRLANDKFCERNRCIVITQLAYDANLLRVPGIRWLGVFTSDFEEYCLPDYCLLDLSSEDRKKLEGILTRCYLHREAPEWRAELEAMLEKGVKFEIEALSASSISFLSQEYIPQKIKLGRHI